MWSVSRVNSSHCSVDLKWQQMNKSSSLIIAVWTFGGAVGGGAGCRNKSRIEALRSFESRFFLSSLTWHQTSSGSRKQSCSLASHHNSLQRSTRAIAPTIPRGCKVSTWAHFHPIVSLITFRKQKKNLPPLHSITRCSEKDHSAARSAAQRPTRNST